MRDATKKQQRTTQCDGSYSCYSHPLAMVAVWYAEIICARTCALLTIHSVVIVCTVRDDKTYVIVLLFEQNFIITANINMLAGLIQCKSLSFHRSPHFCSLVTNATCSAITGSKIETARPLMRLSHARMSNVIHAKPESGPGTWENGSFVDVFAGSDNYLLPHPLWQGEYVDAVKVCVRNCISFSLLIGNASQAEKLGGQFGHACDPFNAPQL